MEIISGHGRSCGSCTLGFLFGWVVCWATFGAKGIQRYILKAEQNKSAVNSSPPAPQSPKTPAILSKRPNWRIDYDLLDWLPRWLRDEDVRRWVSLRANATHQLLLYGSNHSELPSLEEQIKRDEYFWDTVSPDFTFGAANIGLGHRLAQLSYSYLCNAFPNRRQQLVHWDAVGLNDNRAWHHLFEDTPVIAGVPGHWKQGPWGEYKNTSFVVVNEHRKIAGTMGDLVKNSLEVLQDCTHGDYSVHYPFYCTGGACEGFSHPRDLWLLRFAKEPSVQEFYMLLRAQLRQHIKDKVADFIELSFPKDKLVIGVHIRSGNGKDDGHGHFDKANRGDWLNNLPAAIAMIRKHVRMVCMSVLDRYNEGGLGFETDDYNDVLDAKYRIFLATDSQMVLNEFLRQHPTVLSLPQDRVSEGDGVAIFTPVSCTDGASNVQCAFNAQETMLIDAMILSSCDVLLAESYTNFIYSLPASLILAEGRIFCESGRAALGGKYILKEKADSKNLFGDAGWWIHPPPNVMPVRCSQGFAWAARDRSKLNLVQDVS